MQRKKKTKIHNKITKTKTKKKVKVQNFLKQYINNTEIAKCKWKNKLKICAPTNLITNT